MAAAMTRRPESETRQRRERGILAIKRWAWEAAREPSHLSRLLQGVASEGDRSEPELVAQVAVAKAVKRVCAAEQRLAEHAVVARERIERSHRSAVGAGGSCGQGVESANRRRWVIDVSQRVEVA